MQTTTGATYIAEVPQQITANINIATNKPQKTHTNPFDVSIYASDVFRELEQRQQQQHTKNTNKDSHEVINKTEKTTTSAVSSTTVNPKVLLQLPSEVPDDLRQQLLSSGVLNNADISVLDYDKEGDTDVENLPPEHLQHFFSSGGSAQIAESKKVLTYVKPGKEEQKAKKENEQGVTEVLDSNIRLWRYGKDNMAVSSENNEDIKDQQYNRYLPLQINGYQFPKFNINELKNRDILRVVVLAPVEVSTSTYNKASKDKINILNGDLLKTLIKQPTRANFEKWLKSEASNSIERQAVVLLVTQ